MEYEILDDPQGESECREARREGGIEEDGLMLRTPRDGKSPSPQRDTSGQLS